MNICMDIFFILGVISLRFELLDYMMILYLTFWRTVKLFPTVLHHFIFLPAMYQQFLYILTNTCYSCLIIAILVGVECVSTLWFWLPISFLTNHFKPFFMSILVCCIVSLEECLPVSFAQFLIEFFGGFCLFWSYENSLSILDITYPFDVRVFSYLLCCHFIFLTP